MAVLDRKDQQCDQADLQAAKQAMLICGDCSNKVHADQVHSAYSMSDAHGWLLQKRFFCTQLV